MLFPFRFFKMLKIFIKNFVHFIDTQNVLFEHLTKQSIHARINHVSKVTQLTVATTNVLQLGPLLYSYRARSLLLSDSNPSEVCVVGSVLKISW